MDVNEHYDNVASLYFFLTDQLNTWLIYLKISGDYGCITVQKRGLIYPGQHISGLDVFCLVIVGNVAVY